MNTEKIIQIEIKSLPHLTILYALTNQGRIFLKIDPFQHDSYWEEISTDLSQAIKTTEEVADYNEH